MVCLYSFLHFGWVLKVVNETASEKSNKLILSVLLSMLILFSGFKLFSIQKSASQKKEELVAKNAFVAELNTFHGKMVVFDTYTLCLLGNDPIHMAALNKDNQLVTTGDYYQRFFAQYKNYWIARCGSADYLAVMQYLSAHRDAVLFVSEPNRLHMSTDYLNLFYHFPVSYQPLPGHPAVEGVSYSILPPRIKINYYQIQASRP
jgi:hypothetical protein